MKDSTEQDLRNIAKWLNNNDLALNIGKTKWIQFSINKKKEDDNLSLFIHSDQCSSENKHTSECQVIEKVSQIKYLGVIFDKNLNWKEHIKILSRKLLKVTYMMLRIRDIVPETIKRTIYMATVQSKLQYGIAAWGAAYKTTQNSLIIAQKKILKMLYNKPKTFGSEEIFKITKIDTIKTLHAVKTLKYCKKNGTIKYNLSKDKITRNGQLTIPRPKIHTVIGTTNANYQGILHFNKLDKQNREKIIMAKDGNYKKIISEIIRNQNA